MSKARRLQSPCLFWARPYDEFMEKDWRKELRKIIGDQGLSLREVSLRLGKSEGYLKVLLTRENEPGIGTLSKICTELNVPVSSLIEDLPRDAEALQIARTFERLTAEQKSAVKTIMATMGQSQD